MGACEQCIHFRRVKPASQLLSTAFVTTDAAVSGALTKLLEDEQKQRDAEAEYKRAQSERDKDMWASRPVMSDFCGFRETESVYLVAEVKNAGGRCTDFAQGRPERHACAECRHRVPGDGPATDQAMEQQYVSMAVQAVSVNMQPTQADGLLSKYREGVASRKGFELSGAYAAKGVMPGKPLYLDHCARYSTADEWVVCILRNPHHTCPGWEGSTMTGESKATTNGAGATSAAEVPPTAPPAPGPSPVSAATAVAAPPAVAPAAPPPTPAPPTAIPPAAPVDPAIAAASSAPPATGAGELLFAGSPPLTATLVDQVVAYLEWILDVRLGIAHRAMVRQSLVNDWQTGNQGSIDGIQQQLGIYAEVEKADPATRAFYRESNQAAFVGGLRGQNDDTARALLELYDAANQPLTAGDPPLTREAGESFLDVINFMSSVAMGGEPKPVSEEIRKAWMDQLVQQYPTTAADQRAFIAQAPLTWTTMQAVWSQAGEGDKAMLREQFKTELGPALASMEQVRVTAASSGSAAASSQASVATEPEPVDRSIDQLLDDMYAAQAKEEEELMRTNPQLAVQKKMQNQQANAQFMSNMMSMSHQTSMAIIKNMT